MKTTSMKSQASTKKRESSILNTKSVKRQTNILKKAVFILKGTRRVRSRVQSVPVHNITEFFNLNGFNSDMHRFDPNDEELMKHYENHGKLRKRHEK